MSDRVERDGVSVAASGLHASGGTSDLASLANRRPPLSPSTSSSPSSHLERTEDLPLRFASNPPPPPPLHDAASGTPHGASRPHSHSRSASTSSISPRHSRRNSAAQPSYSPSQSRSHSRKSSLAGLAEHPALRAPPPPADDRNPSPSNTSPAGAGYIFDSSFYSSWGTGNGNMLGVMTPSGSSVGESRRGSAMPYTPPAFPPSYPMTGRQMSSMSGTSAAAYGMMGAAASNGHGTSSESSSPRSSMFPHLGEGISGVAEEGESERSEKQASPQVRPHKARSKKKRSSHERSTSPRSASSARFTETASLPIVPARRSSARTTSSPEDADDSPLTSPPLSTGQSQPAGHRLAESSDTSDYGSQADADEDEGLRRVTVDAGTVEASSSSAGDYSNVLQLAGGPPKLQRPQRGPPSADSGSASRRDQLASPSSGSASLESHNKSPPAAAMVRSLSPRKPRVEPGMERQRSVPPPQQQQQQQSSAPTAPTHSSTDSAEAALEAAAIRDADLEDPNRPRTLKEARELAKARAKAREESQSLAPSSSSKRFGQVSPKTSTEVPNGGDTVNSADSAMDELQAAVGSALDDLDFSQPAEESFGNTSGTISVPGDWLPHDRAATTEDAIERSSVDMAYDSAREFDDDEAGADERGHAASAAQGHQEMSVSPNVAPPLSEDGRQVSFDSSSSSTSIRMLRQRSGHSDDGAVVDGQKFMKGGLRNVPERPGALSLAQALELSAPPSPATPQADWNTPRAIPKRMASAAQLNESAASTPKLVQAPSRAAPPTRIDVPGKTVPFPPAFHVSAISVDKRRAPPWERAKAYANFTNELCSIPSGLSLWIEAASRRPIPQSSSNNSKTSFMPGNGPRLPSSLSPTVSRSANSGGDGSFTHPRDVSGASVRSDQTFPIRGDGGKARDITQIPLDTSQPDAYPGAVPSSIPYPSLVPQAPTRSLSSSTGASIKPASMTMTSSASSAGSQSLVGLRARKISSSALDALNAFSGGSSANNTSPTMARERPSGTFSRPAVLGGGGGVTSPQSSSSSSSSSGPPRAGGGGIFSSLGRRNSKRTMTASSSSQSFASAGSGANNSGSSGPRGPRIPGAAGALGRAIGNVHRHGGTGAPAVGSNAVGSSIDLGAMARNPETANAGLAMMPPRNSTSAVQQGSVESPTTPTPQTVNAATTGSVSGPRGPRAPGTLRNSPSVQMLNASASPATGGVAAPTFIPSYPSGGPGGNASPPKKLSSLPQSGGSAAQQQQRPTDYARTGSGNGHGNGNGNGGRTPTTATATTPMEERPDFKEALRKLVDVLPDADEDVLSGYLRRAAGNDLRAIGDYLGDQAKGSLKR